MKKFCTLALLAAATLSMNAADDFVVYNNGQLGALEVMGWGSSNWKFDAADPAGGAEKVFQFNSEGGRGAMGIFNNVPYATGPLHTATLNLSWYTEDAGEYRIRLTSGVEEDYVFTAAEADLKKWNTLSIPVAEKFPAVATAWNAAENKSAGNYVFSILAAEGSEPCTIYLNNIHYTGLDAAWEAPKVDRAEPPTTVNKPTLPAEDVMSLLAGPYEKMANWWIGPWGQSTVDTEETIDGQPVHHLTNFNYLGWEWNYDVDVTKCNYLHVEYYPVEGTTFGFTPIASGENANNFNDLKLGEWNVFDVPLTYYTNCNFQKVQQFKFDNGKNGEGYVANVYFYANHDVQPPVVEDGTDVFEGDGQGTCTWDEKDYPYTYNYSVKYNNTNDGGDDTLTITVDFNWPNGEVVGLVPGAVYIQGPKGEANAEFVAENGKITATTTQTYAEGDKVTVRMYRPYAGNVINDVLVENVVLKHDKMTGVEAVEAADATEAEYYTLQGVKVANPEKGLYIKVCGQKAEKVIIR